MNDFLKSFGLPESIDPGHTYVYKSGQLGFSEYWYVDQSSNYWLYSNAPNDSEDFDPLGGNAFLIPDQVMPHTAPQFYSPEGYKLNMGVPEGVEVIPNENYDPTNPRNIWFEMYSDSKGNSRFVYVDADVRENLDLWIQHQLRITDAGIPAYRKQAKKLFESDNVKDKVVATILMLVDQASYDVNELIFASVSDLEFIDQTVKLLGRKFACDPLLLDFLTSIVAGRDPNDPLFIMETMNGKEPIGIHYIASIFASLKMSAEFLKYWHANHIFSRIVHRLAMQAVPADEVEEIAYNELARVLATPEDVRFLVDVKVREKLFSNYEDAINESEDIDKSLSRVPTDDFGVATVWSDLSGRRSDESEFSVWLHSEPLHDMSPEEKELLEQAVGEPEEPEANDEQVSNSEVSEE